MGFYQDITNDFGRHTAVLMKRWSSFNIKLANGINRRNFLLRCRRNSILPRHIQDATKTMKNMLHTTHWNVSEEMHRHMFRLSKKNLNMEIKVCYCNTAKIKSIIHSIKEQLKDSLPTHILNEFSRRLNMAYDRRFSNVKKANLLKFNGLKQLSLSNAEKLFLNNSGWFKNLSDVDIPTEVSDFLSLGPKFGVSPTGLNLHIKHFLADIEDIIYEVPDQNKNILRANITNNITNFQNKTISFTASSLTTVK